MSSNDTLVSKENWQSYIMNPGPSNSNLLATPINNHKPRPTPPAKSAKQTWACVICKKELSSKRSYTEHMNIHNKTRPFQCEHCVYAAASQMTLHRHKLRSHTPKTEWGYRCPYCDDAYMEPAGYQQHVQQRHPGRSATYGCPFGKCKFSSKSQRHFREHLVKHEKFEKVDDGVDPCILPNHELIRYMVTDDIGRGFKTVTPAPVTIRAVPKATIAPKVYTARTLNTGETIEWHKPNKTVIQSQRYYTPSQASIFPIQSESNCYQNNYDQMLHHSEFDLHDEERSEEYDDGEMDLNEEYEGITEEYDDGPPMLESFEHVMPKMEHRVVDNNWVADAQKQPETTSKEVYFPNGFIDEELD